MKTQKLSVNDRLESEYFSMGGVHKCWGMISIDAPSVPKAQFGVDFVVVIDVSASMNLDQKLIYVQKAIEVILMKLNSSHRLAIVVFNHNVSVLCDLVSCDEKNKDMFKELLEGIDGSGSTNITDAIFEAAKILNQREDQSRISSILLITDGLSNRGLGGDESLSSLSEVSLPEGCTCNTFGVGDEHDSKTLHSIALQTQGVYDYIEKAEMIPTIFSQCVKETLATTATKISVKLRGQDGSRIIALHIPYKVRELKKAKDYDIDLGRISSNETKSILFRLSLRRVTSEMLHNLLKVEVTYSDMFGNSLTTDKMISVERVRDSVKSSIPLDLDENINRYAAAKVINEAIELSNQLKFTEARDKLEKIMDVIASSPSSKETTCLQLVHAVGNCIERMSDIVTFQTGMHAAYTLSSFYFMGKKVRANQLESEAYDYGHYCY